MSRKAAPSMPSSKPDNIAESVRLMRHARSAALATLDARTSVPFASLVNVAMTQRGEPVLLISTLARHTTNLMQNAAGSLLISDAVAASTDPLTGSRITITGRFCKLDADAAGQAAQAYLALHPSAQGYAGFGDFGWWRMVPEEIHLVAGFGRIDTIPAAQVCDSWGLGGAFGG